MVTLIHLSACKMNREILPLALMSLHPFQDPEIGTPCGTIIGRHKFTFHNVFVHCSSLVEWSSHPIRNAESLTIFKTHFFREHLTASYFFHMSLIPRCSSLYYSERCLKHCITSTSHVYLPLYNESLVFLIYKSYWIKASAKRINKCKCKNMLIEIHLEWKSMGQVWMLQLPLSIDTLFCFHF